MRKGNLGLPVILFSSLLGAAELRLCSSVLPPYQTLDRNQLVGRMVDQMACVMNRMGVSYEVFIHPWLRCQRNVLEGR